MNRLRKNVKNIQKCLLKAISVILKSFAKTFGMTYEAFYYSLAEELKLNSEKIEHYARDGLPLPNQHTHEVPIAKERLHNAIKKIFDSEAEKHGYDEKVKNAYSEINECLLDVIDALYFCVEKFEDSMPFFTDDFENYLIAHLVYREAWPVDTITQEDRKLLKESLERFPIKKISHEQQPNVSDEDIRTILSAVQHINRIGSNIEASQTAKNKKERQPES